MQDLSSILGLKSDPVASGVRPIAPEIAPPAVALAPNPKRTGAFRRISFAVVFGLTAIMDRVKTLRSKRD